MDWFGPKGIATVVYGLLVLDGGAPGASSMFHLLAVTVFSILAHSSTDVPIAHYFTRRAKEAKGLAVPPDV